MLSGDIHKKFNTDVRKFSRNYEYSFFLSEYGVGKKHKKKNLNVSNFDTECLRIHIFFFLSRWID